jgi:sn-glycerol 3-phosphate transport system permease protein
VTPTVPTPTKRRRHWIARRRTALSARYIALIVLAIIVVFPIYVIFLDSMLSIKDITGTPPVLFSVHLNWNDFLQAWNTGDLGRALLISVAQAVLTVSGQLITSILAAYAFTFLRFPFRQTLYIAALATLMIPFEVTLVTNFQTVTSLHLYGNLSGLIVPFLGSGLGIFLLRNAFSQIPSELREAAVMDGYSNLGFLRSIAIPLARPSIAALAVFSFLGNWNSYIWPDLITSNNQGLRTIQIAIKQVGAGSISSADIQLAAAAIAALPLLIILVFFQKHLIRSLTAGAVK